MTAKVNNNEATASVSGETITLKVGDQQLKLDVKEITSVLRVLLAARKQAYSKTRAANKAKRDAANAAKVAKLEAQLAKLRGSSEPVAA